MASKRLDTIMVVGSINMDLTTRTARMPQPGETLAAESFDTGPGGKGANQAVACARLLRSGKETQDIRNPDNEGQHQPSARAVEDIEVVMQGALGYDEFGATLQRALYNEGIETMRIKSHKDTKTGVALVIVESSGQNRILLSAGANAKVTPWAGPIEDKNPPALIIMQLEVPLETVLSTMKQAKRRNVPVLLNAAPAIELPREAYRDITHLIINETEAAILQGTSEEEIMQAGNLEKAAQDFLDRGVHHLVITLGSKGCFFANRQGHGLLPAEKVIVKDTTAAGDTFVGAYAVVYVTSMLQGRSFELPKAVAWANKAGAKTVERNGSMASIPFRDEIGPIE